MLVKDIANVNPLSKQKYNNFINYSIVDEGVVVTRFSSRNDVALNAGLYTNGTVFYAYNENKFYTTNNGAISELRKAFFSFSFIMPFSKSDTKRW